MNDKLLNEGENVPSNEAILELSRKHFMTSVNIAFCRDLLAKYAAPATVGPIRIGKLPTMNQDEYPGLGDWWVQLRFGADNGEVLARVYGYTPEEALRRAAMLAASPTPPAGEGQEPVVYRCRLRSDATYTEWLSNKPAYCPSAWEVTALYDHPAPQAAQPAASVSAQAQPVAARGVLSFDPGTLHIDPDGSGSIIIPEAAFVMEDDHCEGPDGPQGSIHWVARLASSEVAGLRDFLNASAQDASKPAQLAAQCNAMHKTPTAAEEAEVKRAMAQVFAKPAPCETCNDEGAVGNILTAQPCPDCSKPAQECVDGCSYGVAPHTCFYKFRGAQMGQSKLKPQSEWPESFEPDPDAPGLGTHHACGWSRNKPAQDEREAFEKWARQPQPEGRYDLSVTQSGVYVDPETRCCYRGWLARAALSTPMGGDALDAKRYRWLRENNIIANVRFHYASGESPFIYAEALDESIDAAIAAMGKGGGQS